MIPRYKNSHKSSIGVLYRPLQEIEIYVEDKDSEVFYGELFKRLLDGEIKIKKVIPLGCRDQVISGSKNQDRSYPKVFIIDGDLHWVCSTFNIAEEDDRLFQHPFYCIENALFCEDAAAVIVEEELGNKSIEDIKNDLAWREWTESIGELLMDLFVTFAVCFKLKPQLRTVSHGIGSVISSKKGQLPSLDRAKVESLKALLIEELRTDYTDDEINQEYDRIQSKIAREGLGLAVISGKNFLLPLLYFKLRELSNCSLTVESRNFRLARHCNLEPLQDLLDFIKVTIQNHRSTAQVS